MVLFVSCETRFIPQLRVGGFLHMASCCKATPHTITPICVNDCRVVETLKFSLGSNYIVRILVDGTTFLV